jgi:hypothetical protein
VLKHVAKITGRISKIRIRIHQEIFDEAGNATDPVPVLEAIE